MCESSIVLRIGSETSMLVFERLQGYYSTSLLDSSSCDLIPLKFIDKFSSYSILCNEELLLSIGFWGVVIALLMWCRMFLPVHWNGILLSPCGGMFYHFSAMFVLPMVSRLCILYLDGHEWLSRSIGVNGRLLIYDQSNKWLKMRITWFMA